MNVIHVSLQDFRGRIDEWIYSLKVERRGQNTPTDDNENSHGGCVVSKAAGGVNGVCKVRIHGTRIFSYR